MLIHDLTFQLLNHQPDSNRCIKVLQTSPLPLGYVAEVLRISLPPKQKSPATWWDWGRRGHFIEEVKIQRRLVRLPRAPCPEGQSGKRDSNPRHQPWQGCALPTELFPQWVTEIYQKTSVEARNLFPSPCGPLLNRGTKNIDSPNHKVKREVAASFLFRASTICTTLPIIESNRCMTLPEAFSD